MRHKETVFLKRPFKPGMSLSAKERSFLPLPLSPVSEWVGLTPFPIGYRKQKIRPPFGHYDAFVSSKFSKEIIGSPNLGYSKYWYIEGNWETNKETLVGYATPPKFLMPTAETLLSYSIDRVDRLGLPNINMKPQRRWLRSVQVNPNAYPGVVTTLLHGGNKRGAYSRSLVTAEGIWDAVVNAPYSTCDNSLWSLGGRERKIDITARDIESRAVLMPETPVAIVAAALVKPIQEGLLLSNFLDKSLECYMGQPLTDGGWDRISQFMVPGKLGIEIDWSKFDSTVIEQAMVASFRILRSCYPPGKDTDKLFIYVMSGTIYKNVALKQRFIYRLRKGLPSGTPFTSVLGTLCNWVLLNYMIRSQKLFGVNEPGDYSLAVAGDDTLIRINKTVTKDDFVPTAEELVDIAKRTTNLDLDLDDLLVGYFEYSAHEFSQKTQDQNFSILKCMIWQGLPGRRLKDLIKPISCPTTKPRSILTYQDVIRGFSDNPIVTPVAFSFLKQFSRWLEPQVREHVGWSHLELDLSPYTGSPERPFKSLTGDRLVNAALSRPPPYMVKSTFNDFTQPGGNLALSVRQSLVPFGLTPD
uniref:RdRp n=1 Tax=viral metagenome TaxID=1070528 RepID=A0A2V0RBY3_9ZZZZ